MKQLLRRRNTKLVENIWTMPTNFLHQFTQLSKKPRVTEATSTNSSRSRNTWSMSSKTISLTWVIQKLFFSDVSPRPTATTFPAKSILMELPSKALIEKRTPSLTESKATRPTLLTCQHRLKMHSKTPPIRWKLPTITWKWRILSCPKQPDFKTASYWILKTWTKEMDLVLRENSWTRATR